MRVLRSSSVYETDPVGGPAQPTYRNAVVEVETDLDPLALLDRCLAIEAERGRVRDPAERAAPRVLDVDVLRCGDLVRDEARLTIPHPRMHERAFVLVPLAELEGGEPPASEGVRLAGPPLRLPG